MPDADAPVANDDYAKLWRGTDHRTPSLMSFIYGAFNPRRRRIRRVQDRNHAFIDWYPDHLFFAAITIVCLSVVDGIFTVHLVSAGEMEFNSLLAALLNNDVTRFALAKIALTAIGVTSLVIVSQARLFKKWPMTGVLYGLLAAYAALIIHSYNLIRSLT